MPSFSEEEKNKALNCFARGKELADKKNYEYAIEMYLSGLDHWPEAVEEGHKPCRAAALFRGGKKIGFTDKMKFGTSGKDFKKAMLNAERLLAMEPNNIGYMEAFFKNAAKGGFDETAMWIGEVYTDAACHLDKPNAAHFLTMREVYEEIGDRNTASNPAMAVKALDRAVTAMSRVQQLKPTDMSISTQVRDLAGKLTIVKGKYTEADSFRDSLHDAETQRDLHDQERGRASDDRMEDMIGKARTEYETTPKDSGAVTKFVDLLCRRENDKEENQAIEVLLQAHQTTGEYRHKMRADDIRMKQLNRRARAIVATGDKDAARQHIKDQLRFELGVFKERGKVYPTDMRIRYQYGVRLFKAGRYDEAIPVLQEARADPKARHNCSLHIGRCFYEKSYYPPAINTFREAINNYETPDDELGKQLYYWLGRSQEGNGDTADALKTYGQIIEWDYNYRNGEVRKRIDDLNKSMKSGNQG